MRSYGCAYKLICIDLTLGAPPPRTASTVPCALFPAPSWPLLGPKWLESSRNLSESSLTASGHGSGIFSATALAFSRSLDASKPLL